MQPAQQQQLTPDQALLRAKDLYEENKLQACEKICRDLIAIQPNNHSAYFQLALVAVKVNRLPMAANMLQQAIQIEPMILDYQRALGEIFRRIGDFEKAVFHGEQAIKIGPQDAEAYYNTGLAYADSGNLEKAVEYYKKALKIRPSYSVASNNLGTALENMDDEEGALEAYRQAVQFNPSNAQAQNNLGAVLIHRGDVEEATKCFEASVTAENAFVPAHYNLSTLKKYTPEDPQIKMLERLQPHLQQMGVEDRIKYCFAVGKAFEDIGRYDASFAAFRAGNKMKRDTLNFNVNVPVNQFKTLENSYDKKLANKKVKGCDSDLPVFILGMPRSGTTLIEQVLDTHSKVFGAGELKEFADTFFDISKIRESADGSGVKNYVEWLLGASDEDIEKVGQAYVDKLRAYDKKAIRITDKMPGNFHFIGLIHKVLPNAKIIHTVRDPYDTCISNFSRLYTEDIPFSYDLGDLGTYYKAYASLMEHWRSVLPKGKILDVVYEEMVDDFENQAKRIIEHCGLKWEEQCLEFYNNKRHVKTASVAQVRKPIYKDSVSRAQRYQQHIQPLIQALETNGG